MSQLGECCVGSSFICFILLMVLQDFQSPSLTQRKSFYVCVHVCDLKTGRDVLSMLKLTTRLHQGPIKSNELPMAFKAAMGGIKNMYLDLIQHCGGITLRDTDYVHATKRTTTKKKKTWI